MTSFKGSFNKYGKHLIVEGDGDCHAIVHLIKKRFTWHEGEHLVTIEDWGGNRNILRPGDISSKCKGSGVKVVGIVLDADTDCASRWQSVRNLCLHDFPTLPDDLPIDGLIIENKSGVKLGVWIMPNNSSAGMLETFLSNMIPSASSDPVLQHARASASAAKDLGAAYKTTHKDKAELHTWLAWIDPPGTSFGMAICNSALDIKGAECQLFVDWLQRLFELTPLP